MLSSRLWSLQLHPIWKGSRAHDMQMQCGGRRDVLIIARCDAITSVTLHTNAIGC